MVRTPTGAQKPQQPLTESKKRPSGKKQAKAGTDSKSAKKNNAKGTRGAPRQSRSLQGVVLYIPDNADPNVVAAAKCLLAAHKGSFRGRLSTALTHVLDTGQEFTPRQEIQIKGRELEKMTLDVLTRKAHHKL